MVIFSRGTNTASYQIINFIIAGFWNRSNRILVLIIGLVHFI